MSLLSFVLASANIPAAIFFAASLPLVYSFSHALGAPIFFSLVDSSSHDLGLGLSLGASVVSPASLVFFVSWDLELGLDARVALPGSLVAHPSFRVAFPTTEFWCRSSFTIGFADLGSVCTLAAWFAFPLSSFCYFFFLPTPIWFAGYQVV